MKNVYLFSMEAVFAILLECFCRGFPGETGGILIGPVDKPYVVTDVIASSVHAERGAATYFQSAQDVEHLNQELKKYQAVGKDYKGDWHKHPSRLFVPSHGDASTFHDVLTNPDYVVNNHLIQVIVAEGSEFPLFTYGASINAMQGLDIQQRGFKIMPKRFIENGFNCVNEKTINKGNYHASYNFEFGS